MMSLQQNALPSILSYLLISAVGICLQIPDCFSSKSLSIKSGLTAFLSITSGLISERLTPSLLSLNS